jgi:ATP-binding cassette, subfamily G (WHITE), member 2, SNQ2
MQCYPPDLFFYTSEEVILYLQKVFTWEHLDYTVPVPGGTRRLLEDVFGYVEPGTLTALMGASGAGKLRRVCGWM